MKTPRPVQCTCGYWPEVINEQVSEDCCETWVECKNCGKTGPEYESSFGAYDGAVLDWNDMIDSEVG